MEEVAGDIKESAMQIKKEMELSEEEKRQRQNIFAAILIGLGVLLLIDQFVPGIYIGWKIFWPVLIILAGFYVIFKR